MVDNKEIKIITKPFDWNDNLSEDALEAFGDIQKDLSYGICQTIGIALGKLSLLEKQGAKVEVENGNDL